jgi:hypothetical protein
MSLQHCQSRRPRGNRRFADEFYLETREGASK